MSNERTKTCTRCGDTKPATNEFFSNDKKRKGGLNCWCKICVNASKQEWRIANNERHKAARRAWYATNRERADATARAYEMAHKELRAVINKKYRDANQGVRRAGKQRRRARELNAPGHFSAADVRAQHKRQKGECYYCGADTRGSYHIDHVVPLSRGGTNFPDNIVISCPTCNQSKGNKLLHEWVGYSNRKGQDDDS